MNDKTCKTCRWWCKIDLYLQRLCECPKMRDTQAIDGACDDEDYGGINTGPDFGCVHHEPEEPHP